MKAFDDIIRRKLETLNLRQEPQWEEMQQRLEGQAFDDMLRQSITPQSFAPLHSEQEMAAWDRLEAALDHESELAADTFDRLLSQKLATAEMRSEASAFGWRQLSTRMDTFWPLRRRIVRSRVLELAAAVGLLISFAPLLNHPFSPFDSEIGYSLHKGQPMETEKVTFDTEAEWAAVQALSSDAEPTWLELLSAAWSDAPAKPVMTSSVAEATSAQGASAAKRSAQAHSGIGLSAARLTAAQRPDIFRRRSQGLFPATAFPASELSAGSSTPALSAEVFTFSMVEIFFSNLAQPQMDGQEGQNKPSEVAETALAGNVPALATKVKPQWQVGLGAGMSQWMIHSPGQANFNVSPALHRDREFRAEAHTIFKPRARWCIALGLGVSSFEYQPSYPTVISPLPTSIQPPIGRKEAVQSIGMLAGQTSLALRYDVLPKGGANHLWVQAGAMADIALRNQSEIRSDIDQIPVLMTEIETTMPGQRTVLADQNYSQVQNSRPGLFDGGGLSQNTSIAALVGLEYERSISDRGSLFASAAYTNTLGGGRIGANNDQLDALHLSVGARLRL